LARVIDLRRRHARISDLFEPPEFASRNIFTEERPLRRARGPWPPENES
jgi:hypothetical protein